QISIDRIWHSDRRHPSQLVPMDAVGLLYDELDDLSPSTDQQRATKAQVTSLAAELKEMRWLLFIQSGNDSVSAPLLLVLDIWLAAIFISFGLFAPPNRTVIATLAVTAFAVTGAIFIILEMYTPFS